MDKLFELKSVEAFRTEGGRLMPRSLILQRLAAAQGSTLEPTTAWVVTFKGEIVTGPMARAEAEAHRDELEKAAQSDRIDWDDTP